MMVVLSSAFLCFFGCLTVVYHERSLAGFSFTRADLAARQASHVGNPLRLGGVLVLISLAVGVCYQSITKSGSDLELLLVSAVPVVLAGLLEDLGIRISPRVRLIAALVSGAAAMLLTGVCVSRANIPAIDWLVATPAVAIVTAIIFSAGLCNGVNLIDGMNGLSSVVVIMAASGCSVIAEHASQPEIMWFARSLVAAMAGFAILNWPIARLFLGDAGAYGLGHLLAWLMLLLAARSHEVAVPALLLLLFWPIADVTHTILRRMMSGAAISRPDRMHLHQKVRRTLDLVLFGSKGRDRSNPLTTLILLPFITAPVIAGAVLWNQPGPAWVAVGVFVLAFAAAHPLTTWVAIRYRK